MATFDNLFKCSLGGETFQLADYTFKIEPIVDAKVGRTGTKLELTGEGWVEVTDASTWSAALGAASEAFQIDGVDVVIVGPNSQVEAAIYAGTCLLGGPNITLEVLKQSGGAALVKNLRFTAKGECNANQSKQPEVTLKTKIATRPDGLTIVTITGEIKGQGSSDYMTAVLLPQFQAQYPAAQYVTNYEYTSNAGGDDVTFEATFAQLAEPYPPAGAGNTIVDGDTTTRTERDEQHRLVNTTSYDLLFTGDPGALVDALRPQTPVIPSKPEPRLSCVAPARYGPTAVRSAFKAAISVTRLAGVLSKLNGVRCCGK